MSPTRTHNPSEGPGDIALSAWLDAELTADEHAQVSDWLDAHPEDAARVRLWNADQFALRQTLDADLSQPLPEAWLAQVRPLASAPPSAAPLGRARALPAAWRTAGWMLASAMLGAVVGAQWRASASGPSASLVRAITQAAPVADWVQRAAVAHTVYVPEKRHPVEVAVDTGSPETQRAQEAHLTQWLTRRLSVPVPLFNLHAQGFALVGGRLLPDGQAPGAQLMYENGHAQRVTVYLRRTDTPADTAFRYEQLNGLSLFYWVDGASGYALAGPLPRAEMLALAEAIHAQRPPGTAASSATQTSPAAAY